MMRQLFSTMYATANELGVEEIQLEYHRNWAEMLWTALKFFDFDQEMTVVETYVVDGTRWVDKVTREPVDEEKQWLLFDIKGRSKHLDEINEFYGVS